MIKICLFDLDQTLLRTSDMKEVREQGKNVSGAAYVASVKAAFLAAAGRHIYTLAELVAIRTAFQGMNLGVFTRSPRSYANGILDVAYPGFHWDIVVAYEDVEKRKPHGEGIDRAMHAFGVKNLDEVVLVGDECVDVRAAYNAGCLVFIDKGAWPPTREKEHWKSLDLMPDAVFDGPAELREVLADWTRGLPELERLLSTGGQRLGVPRFGKVNKFIPKEAGGDNTPFPIHACGRYFAKYDSIKWRRKWHGLTKSIEDQKEADSFPAEWIDAVRAFISTNYFTFWTADAEIHVTVVPHRPGRTPRLEAFLAQLEASCLEAPPADNIKLVFHRAVLEYRDGVKSQSKEHLGQIDRFNNVREHLFVAQPAVAKGARFLVIDDVSTTGASLIYARKYLKDAGASEVTCLSIAMNIGDVLWAK